MLLCVTVWTKSVCWLGLCQVCIQIIWVIIICSWFSGNCAVIQKHVQCKLLLYAQPVLFTLSVSFCVCHMRWREAMGTNKDAFQWEASHHIMLHAMCTPLKTHSSVRIWMCLCLCVSVCTGRTLQTHRVRHSLQTGWLHPKKTHTPWDTSRPEGV